MQISRIPSLGPNIALGSLDNLTRMELVLALDAGTSGVRTVAFDPDLGAVDEAYLELTQYFPAPGEVEHDADEIARLAVATLRDVASRVLGAGHQIKALAITNQR